MPHADRALSRRGATVQDDWRAWLPDHKLEVFQTQLRLLESPYTMFSISLNEAIGLRGQGQVAKACQAVYMVSSLCTMMVHPLGALLRSLSEHARHFGTVPNAAPLDPENFHSSRCQRASKISGLFSRVLLTQRNRFFHKLSSLEEMIENLEREFHASAGELSDGAAVNTAVLWQSVDDCHFDLNTCLRETTVLLKSFLMAVPPEQLLPFETIHQRQLCAGHQQETAHRVVRHRRMAPIRGQ